METLFEIHTIMYILAGAGVGLAVGVTGVGGGSLMTPLLLLFGFPTHIAIGTDLIYAAITKSGGVFSHQRQSTIQWDVVFRLARGSIPASIITVILLNVYFEDSETYTHVLVTTLGVMLILTSIVLLFKKRLQAISKARLKSDSFLTTHRNSLTTVMGVLLGICVTLSSVGAGAFGAAILLVLYPHLSPIKVIGTDIAHAVPLTLIAGLGHLSLGNVNFILLFSLLIGSLPAIHLGTMLGKRLPDKVLQPTLASILLIIGVKYAFF
ncbi:sulfite exporter TauE/SafE family protein [Alkalimarinus alittae]|uniref:Probable membrane transporter protein n=1 Tax=Alkalimarinus alittae TaxID=2961619 RepID=A0ABY6N6S4_9ALTE|nr:sulfite exporter TauE/SafE family protein [Alkalimarinus alittae]UZE97823.1 sulfite exporter TauE/SafE family protein [Alkalimarinus alittae]